MRYAIWIIVAAAIGLACGHSAQDNAAPDAAPDAGPKGPPIGFTFEASGAGSFVSFGWAGNVHGVKVPDGTPFGVTTRDVASPDVINCQGSDGPCKFTGPIQPTTAKVERRRCLNRMSKVCEKDEDCPSQDKCVFIYDPPAGTPLVGAGGKLGACGWSYIPFKAEDDSPAILGSLDQTSGEVTLQSLPINLALNGNGGSYRGSCAVCVGDVTPNDGVKQGKCMALTDTTAPPTDPSLRFRNWYQEVYDGNGFDPSSQTPLLVTPWVTGEPGAPVRGPGAAIRSSRRPNRSTARASSA